MKITYVGHATLLLEMEGVRVLTDPNYERRLGGFLPRVSAPGIPIAQLGELDAILLTHAHADHLSFTTLRQLARTIPLYAPPAVARWLRRRGFAHAIDLGPGESVSIGAVCVHAAAATHRGNRYGFDRWRAATNMYLLDSGRESVFFAGDTALVDDTHHLAQRVVHAVQRQLDVALLPIGQPPSWKLASFRKGHLTPADALTLFERLDARVFVPYHWGTFHHVTSRAHDAMVRLVEELKQHHRRAAVRVLEPGEALALGRTEPEVRIVPRAAAAPVDDEAPRRRAVDRVFDVGGDTSATP